MIQTKKIIGVFVLGAVFAASGAVVQPAHAQTLDAETSAKLQQALSSITVLLQDISSSYSAGEPSADTAAADLRVTLNSLLREHVNLGMLALYNVIDNSDATAASVAALDENTVELAAAVGSVYGNEAEAEFRQIWRDHIGFFANYATGLRTDDPELRDQAEEDLAEYQQDIAAFFSGAVPSIDSATVVAGAGEHKDLLIEAMEEYDDGDYEAAYEAQREADKQIAGIANLLANGIVMQFPEKF